MAVAQLWQQKLWPPRSTWVDWSKIGVWQWAQTALLERC
jgi:hypothetical protein